VKVTCSHAYGRVTVYESGRVKVTCSHAYGRAVYESGRVKVLECRAGSPDAVHLVVSVIAPPDDRRASLQLCVAVRLTMLSLINDCAALTGEFPRQSING